MKPEYITAATAIKALPAKGPIHCFAGFIGADWTKRSVERELKMADKIAWIDHFAMHELAVQAGPKSGWHGRSILYFQVRRPNAG